MPLRMPGSPDPTALPEWRAPRQGQEALEWLSHIFGGPESIAGLTAPIALVGYRALAKEAPDLIEALRRLVSIKHLDQTLGPEEGLALARLRAQFSQDAPLTFSQAWDEGVSVAPSFIPTIRTARPGIEGIPRSLARERFPKLELSPAPPSLESQLEELAGVRVGGGGEAPAMPHTIAGQKRLRADIIKAWLKGARGAERQEIRDMAELPLEHWQRIFPLTHDLRPW